MPIPLIVPIALAGVAAYALFSKSSSAAAPSPSSPYSPSATPASGNVSPTPGGPSGGSSTSSSSSSNPYAGPSSYDPNAPLNPGQSAPYYDPNAGTAVFPGTPGQGGGGLDSGGAPIGPAASSQGVNADPSIWDSITGLFSSGSSSGAVGAGSFPDCTLPDGSPGFFSDHPHVLAVTGGRGGYVHDYPGRIEGYAPPGGMPIF